MIACGKSAYREARWWVCAMAAVASIAMKGLILSSLLAI